ncbi:hypothetical protein DICA3_F21396 [Diutina catenulata]
MRAMNLPKRPNDKLLSLLYSAASVEVAPKVPMVQSYLYQDATQAPSGSVLDSLMEKDWTQKPAVDILSHRWVKEQSVMSNVLKYPCFNQFISEKDFVNIFPANRERAYRVPGPTKQGLAVTSIKSRNPLTLVFQDAYYLVFKNTVEAALYAVETRGRALNGISLNLQMVEPNMDMISHCFSPFLFKNQRQPAKVAQLEKFPSTGEIFRGMAKRKNQANKAETLTQGHESLNMHPNFAFIRQLANPELRQRSVMVRHMPFGLSKHTIPRMLWDYELESVQTLVEDIVRASHIQLFIFKSSSHAQRFVRNWHGKHWEMMQHHRQEKKFHSPILCEIIA